MTESNLKKLTNVLHEDMHDLFTKEEKNHKRVVKELSFENFLLDIKYLCKDIEYGHYKTINGYKIKVI